MRRIGGVPAPHPARRRPFGRVLHLRSAVGQMPRPAAEPSASPSQHRRAGIPGGLCASFAFQPPVQAAFRHDAAGPAGKFLECDGIRAGHQPPWTCVNIHAVMYRPAPNTACAIRLRRRAVFGCGVLLAAIPAPRPGCRMKKGAATLRTPNSRAGASVGCCVQVTPTTPSSIAAKTIPMP
ncbi:hypothetical protein G6F22_016445 [Rhizopus arrhizus]|nr:hypothetical protein G6F22_016445 [Rhizopus arrhizus]